MGGLQTKMSVFALPHPGLLPNGEGEIAGRFNEKITVPGKLSALGSVPDWPLLRQTDAVVIRLMEWNGLGLYRTNHAATNSRA